MGISGETEKTIINHLKYSKKLEKKAADFVSFFLKNDQDYSKNTSVN